MKVVYSDDQRLKAMFLEAVRFRFGSPAENTTSQPLLEVLDTSDFEVQAAGLVAQIDEVAKKVQALITHNARVAQDQHAYEQKFNATHQQHQALLAQHAEIYAQIQSKQNRLAAYRYYRQETTNLDINNLAFSPYMCVTPLDKGVVSDEGIVTFQFRDGSTQTVAIKP